MKETGIKDLAINSLSLLISVPHSFPLSFTVFTPHGTSETSESEEGYDRSFF